MFDFNHIFRGIKAIPKSSVMRLSVIYNHMNVKEVHQGCIFNAAAYIHWNKWLYVFVSFCKIKQICLILEKKEMLFAVYVLWNMEKKKRELQKYQRNYLFFFHFFSLDWFKKTHCIKKSSEKLKNGQHFSHHTKKLCWQGTAIKISRNHSTERCCYFLFFIDGHSFRSKLCCITYYFCWRMDA